MWAYITAVTPTKHSDVGAAALGPDLVLTFNEEFGTILDPKQQVGLFILGLKIGVPLHGPQAVAAGVTISGNTITVNPNDPLLPSMRHSVILDLSGGQGPSGGGFGGTARFTPDDDFAVPSGGLFGNWNDPGSTGDPSDGGNRGVSFHDFDIGDDGVLGDDLDARGGGPYVREIDFN